MEYKQVILVRQDLKLPKGKMSAQAAHASVEAALNSPKKLLEAWRKSGAKKVILKVKDKKELIEFKKKAEMKGLTSALIVDAGKTVLPKETATCLGIGPDEEKKIDAVTGKLKIV